MRHEQETAHREVDFIASKLVYGSKPGLKNLFGGLTERLMIIVCRFTRRKANEARLPITCRRPCAFQVGKSETKNKRNPAAFKPQHQTHSSTATAANSRRLATNQVPRVTPSSPASADPFGTNRSRTALTISNISRRHIAHNKLLNNGRMYAPRHENAFLPIDEKAASMLVER